MTPTQGETVEEGASYGVNAIRDNFEHWQSAWEDLKVRGLGGYFTGDATMESDGDRRVLTERGRRWIDFYESDFGPYETP